MEEMAADGINSKCYYRLDEGTTMNWERIQTNDVNLFLKSLFEDYKQC